ncbi:hypothetical protein T459_27354 [Capsicum annuum]|uniref:Uncharacterized protein n=1 Tax=Capsicum annuum TaxID=4072 RepID=A0A2G2YDP4_CAPAN|nr:hypothetical protein T459_27354 [Capsicum annuum]
MIKLFTDARWSSDDWLGEGRRGGGVNGGGGGGLSDVSPMQKVVAEFDEWEMAGGEEEMMVSVGEMLSRFVFGGALSLQEATKATSDLKHALEKYVIYCAIAIYITQTVVDMMNSLSDFFNNLFGGNKVFFNADGNTKLGTVEMTLGASFMGLAVMVRMVIVSKRGQS